MKWVLIWLNVTWLGSSEFKTEEACLETGKNAAIGLQHIFKYDDEKVKFLCIPKSNTRDL